MKPINALQPTLDSLLPSLPLRSVAVKRGSSLSSVEPNEMVPSTGFLRFVPGWGATRAEGHWR